MEINTFMKKVYKQIFVIIQTKKKERIRSKMRKLNKYRTFFHSRTNVKEFK